jgi:N-acyl homoserine lactone hydrolase
MKIHAIQTGTVAITTRWREGAGHGRLRLVNTQLDGEWTEPLPIYAFAIEHPEGVIVVDTGETARTSQPGYFPGWHLASHREQRRLGHPDRRCAERPSRHRHPQHSSQPHVTEPPSARIESRS